ncbi:prenyltransferase family protein isoform X2 [Wolffia australiana]
MESGEGFDRERHVFFMEMMYELLPSEYESEEINRITLAYFVVSGLDILGSLDRVSKDQVARWVLSFYSRPDVLEPGTFYGFHGSRTSQHPANKAVSKYNAGHLASTYCALAILKTIGYDFSNFDSNAISASMQYLQQPNGSFIPIHCGAESDLRFVYCAAAICSIINDWRGMDKEKAKNYIISCQSYDGGFGLVPGSESHGGATYCAVAALRLMGYIEEGRATKFTESSMIDVALLLEWALQRQASDGGFQGRSNKASDTCYAFWVLGVLRILGAHQFIDRESLRSFLLSCQSKWGGFSKFPELQMPDLYHSYYGLAAFGLVGELGLTPLQVELGVTMNPGT